LADGTPHEKRLGEDGGADLLWALPRGQAKKGPRNQAAHTRGNGTRAVVGPDKGRLTSTHPQDDREFGKMRGGVQGRTSVNSNPAIHQRPVFKSGSAPVRPGRKAKNQEPVHREVVRGITTLGGDLLLPVPTRVFEGGEGGGEKTGTYKKPQAQKKRGNDQWK